MSETDQEIEQPVPHEEDDDAAALIAEVQTNEKGDKYVGLSTHIGLRKEAKAQKRRIAELEAKNTEYAGIEERLSKVLPIAEAVEKDPRLAAEIKAALDGTRTSKPTTEQPQDDKDALEYAEIHGLVTKDQAGNDVYDVARARRGLDIEARNSEKRIKPQIDAANNAAFGMRGEQNLTAMFGLTTKDGEPLASEESIRQILKESDMPIRMLADERVAKTVARMAAGLDREQGRTPKAPVEPMYLERAMHRRSESTLSESDRRMAQRVGLSDADMASAGKAKPNRRGEIDLE